MSRIGKLPVAIPAGVDVSLSGETLTVKGPKGSLSLEVNPNVAVEVDSGKVEVACLKSHKFARSMFGTTRSLINNMVIGVNEGYKKELELQGVGFRAQLNGQVLVLNLGYSHPIEFPVPEGLTVEVVNNTAIVLTSADKQQVGQAAAQIRAYYKAEPYKGKGVRYKGEVIRRKVGKAVA